MAFHTAIWSPIPRPRIKDFKGALRLVQYTLASVNHTLRLPEVVSIANR